MGSRGPFIPGEAVKPSLCDKSRQTPFRILKSSAAKPTAEWLEKMGNLHASPAPEGTNSFMDNYFLKVDMKEGKESFFFRWAPLRLTSCPYSVLWQLADEMKYEPVP